MALGADGASSSNSSNSTRRWKYDVFLSFRGEDTRKNFTDHLYAALEREGIITFRDNEELERGQDIKTSLLQVIEESFSAVVVLSRNYASSTWCLDELDKILRSKKELGQQVFPIFYGVDPSDVRHQRESFEEAFRKHDEKFTEDREKVQKWRYALQEVANLSGWDSKDWHETRLIEKVTEAVWSKLDCELLSDSEILVGINSKIKEMDSLSWSEKLKFIDLSYSTNLIKTPNFVGIRNLERLVLEGCRSLVEVHHSLGQLKKLILLNLKGCKSLKTLPGKLVTDSLETLVLSGCSKVKNLSEFGENMKCLSTLNLKETAIVKLPESLAYLTSLAILNLKNCKNLLCLPSVIWNLKHLKKINFSGCSKFERFQDNLNENKALEDLDVSKTAIKKAPSFSSLSSLTELNLSYCNINDGSLLQSISGLSSLVDLDLSGNNFVNLPIRFISKLLKLERICFRYCPKLRSLPELPPNVENTDASDCASMETLSDTQVWDLFASLDLQQHSQRFNIYNHVINLALPGKEIPSWFHNQMVDDIVMSRWESRVSFIADIPDYCLSSEWWGIAVCLLLQADKVSAPCRDPECKWYIGWGCGYRYESMESGTPAYRIYEQYNSINQLYIFYIPGRLFSTKRLELNFYLDGPGVHRWKKFTNWEIKRCGWRVLCKEDSEGSNNNQQEKENCNKCLELEDSIIYHCPIHQSLPKLPPNVRTTYASDCASMEPLLDTQLLWDLVVSIDWECLQWCVGYPFKLTLIGKKIPSWFHNQNCSFGREMGPSVSMSSVVSIIADMPHHCCSSDCETGIVVCLVLQANIVPTTSSGEPWINWKYYTYGDHEMWDEGDTWGRRPIHEQYNSTYQVHIFYISNDDFWGKKLKVDFSIEMEQNPGVHKQNMPVNWGIKRCWWRVLCWEDIEAWRQTRSEGYNSNIEFASQHLDGFNEVRITEDTHQNQCDHEITEEDGANSYAKHNQQDKGSSNECFKDISDDVTTQTIEHATCNRKRTIQVKERKSKKERRTLRMGDASLAWAEASKARAEVLLAKDTSSTFISADYSIAKCMAALEEIEDVSDDIYNKALEKFTNPDWREMFLTMSSDRKRGWLVRL